MIAQYFIILPYMRVIFEVQRTITLFVDKEISWFLFEFVLCSFSLWEKSNEFIINFNYSKVLCWFFRYFSIKKNPLGYSMRLFFISLSGGIDWNVLFTFDKILLCSQSENTRELLFIRLSKLNLSTFKVFNEHIILLILHICESSIAFPFKYVLRMRLK